MTYSTRIKSTDFKIGEPFLTREDIVHVLQCDYVFKFARLVLCIHYELAVENSLLFWAEESEQKIPTSCVGFASRTTDLSNKGWIVYSNMLFCFMKVYVAQNPVDK